MIAYLVVASLVFASCLGGIEFVHALSECANPSHVLVLRTNEEHACVTEKTAERTGWEIINLSQPIVEAAEDPTLEIPVVSTNGTIPNPTGYWVPIEDPDAFAALMIEAAGDTLVEKKEFYYKTTYGKLTIDDEPNISMQVFANVLYTFDIHKDVDPEIFIKNFLEKMEFEYEELNYQSIGYQGDKYSITNGYQTISFMVFYHAINFEHMTSGYTHSIHLKFNGWTNNPELIPTEFPLSKSEAIKKVQTFALQSEEINNSNRLHFSNCGSMTLYEEPVTDEDVKLSLFYGKPYYQIRVGHCEVFSNHSAFPIFLIDAYTGDDIYVIYWGGLD